MKIQDLTDEQLVDFLISQVMACADTAVDWAMREILARLEKAREGRTAE
jgi:hypothetical protein